MYLIIHDDLTVSLLMFFEHSNILDNFMKHQIA